MVDEIKSIDDLPVCLNVPAVAKMLGAYSCAAYKLASQAGLPAIRVGEKRIVELSKEVKQLTADRTSLKRNKRR